MTSVVQHPTSYTQAAQLYLFCGFISLSGIYGFPVEIASYPIDLVFAAALLQGLCVTILKMVVQKDISGSFLAAVSMSALIAPSMFASITPLFSTLLFSIAVAPLALSKELDQTTTELLSYVGEIRREIRRISWPTVQETLKFVSIVSAFVTGAAFFWALVDRLIQAVFSILFYYLG